jgi:hypothetical protein
MLIFETFILRNCEFLGHIQSLIITGHRTTITDTSLGDIYECVLAHPAYLAKYFSNQKKFQISVLEKNKGLI